MAGPSAPVDFKVLFEKSAALFLVLDRDLRVVAATDAYCQSVRSKREHLIGLTVAEMFPDRHNNPGAGGFEKLDESLRRVMRLRRPDTMAIQRYDMLRPKSDGGGFIEKYWSPRNSPVLDDDGEVRWIVHRVYDVTDAILNPEAEESRRELARNQERLILELQRNNEELAQLDALRAGLMKMARLSTMATMASALAHDVSQPLTAARNYLSALRRSRAGQNDKTDELIGKIAQQVERAGEIVKSLRSFMAAGNTVQRPERVDAVVADAVRLADSAIKAAGARLAVEVEPDLPPVTMDRIQIQQVIVNLLTNAAEAVEGRADRTIKLKAAAAPDGVRLVVSDRGEGLAPDIVKQFFEPLATTNLSGTGLGLAIAHQIVAEHKGTLAVAANAPNGAVFIVTLPASCAEAASENVRAMADCS